MSQEIQCPLCMEDYDLEDLSFIPCTCGYQICRFCWHRIKTGENGTCPACRKPYTEDPAHFKPLSSTELHETIKLKKLKQQEEKEKKRNNENRKNFANARIIQKNLMFVVGLPLNIIDSEVLKRQEHFGKFGKITKVTLNKTPTSNGHANAQNSTYQYQSAYVMFSRIEDTLRAIKSINTSQQRFGKSVKASLGTTKYCSRFIKGLQCLKSDCMYLHEAVEGEACFTKEEIQQGKHVAYEQKLYLMYCKDDSSSTSPTPDASAHDTTVPLALGKKGTTESKSDNSKQPKTRINQSMTTESSSSQQKKPVKLGQSNCWKISGATIVKSNLRASATQPSSVTLQKTTMTTFTRNGIQHTTLQVRSNGDRNVKPEEKKEEVVESVGSESVKVDEKPTRTSPSSDDNNSEEDEEEEELKRLMEDVDDNSSRGSGFHPRAYSAECDRPEREEVDASECATSPVTSTSDESRSLASSIGSSKLPETDDSKSGENSPSGGKSPESTHDFPENDEILRPRNALATPIKNFALNEVTSTPQAKGQMMHSVLDVSGIEADLADLTTQDSESVLDSSRSEDHHDDDLDPWKIVSIGLDLLENERMLEEQPNRCRDSSGPFSGTRRPLLAGSRYDFFSGSDGLQPISNSDVRPEAAGHHAQHLQTAEEMLYHRRQQQRMHMLMQQQQQLHIQHHQAMAGQRNPSFPAFEQPSPGVPFCGADDRGRPFYVPQPVPGHYPPSVHLHQQHQYQQQQQQQYQMYLHQQHLQRQQQQLEMFMSQQQQQQQQLSHSYASYNGVAPPASQVPSTNQIKQQQQESDLPSSNHLAPAASQGIASEQKRWQDGLKALFPNVNISFGPSPPFVKDHQSASSGQNDTSSSNVSMNGGFRSGESMSAPMHEMASIDPAIVNTGAVASYTPINESFAVQQHQHNHVGVPCHLPGYSRNPQPLIGHPFDWLATNSISETSQTARRTNCVLPPPGFENILPQRKDPL